MSHGVGYHLAESRKLDVELLQFGSEVLVHGTISCGSCDRSCKAVTKPVFLSKANKSITDVSRIQGKSTTWYPS